MKTTSKTDMNKHPTTGNETIAIYTSKYETHRLKALFNAKIKVLAKPVISIAGFNSRIHLFERARGSLFNADRIDTRLKLILATMITANVRPMIKNYTYQRLITRLAEVNESKSTGVNSRLKAQNTALNHASSAKNLNRLILSDHLDSV
ncbi:hypothetical protein QWY82_00885 [Simiduia curdlanivorans]|uniref:Uncharacterized protein n=1 Tax=Simiduia curdlanivorans TaxID=1492769 RepID=A0ABV8V265_9GAMM|nr:hypothetical protein [Simiduia curdlanivorans]MDN3637349.1 hypothetical protein [Simiduia curdlanivorans]